MFKGMLNSVYGITVTDIDSYNSKKSRFLFYPWGVWVTAYARRNLWLGISSFKEDYIYSDTDSIKFFNYSKHEEFIKAYNEMVLKKQLKTLNYYEFNPVLLSPKTVQDLKGDR